MSEFLDALMKADHDLRREHQVPTHWLFAADVRVRLRTEYYQMRNADAHSDPDQFMGYRIYVDRSLPDGAWQLCTGTPLDTVREDDLREQMDKLYHRYRAEAEPLINELAEIESRKPPRPIFLDEQGQIKAMSHVRQNLVAPAAPDGA